MYYLTQKPITAFFCPACLNWHEIPIFSQCKMEDFLNKTAMDESKSHARFLKDRSYFYCYDYEDFKRSPQYFKMIYSPDMSTKHYYISFQNESIYFSGRISRALEHPFECSNRLCRSMEGSITLHDIIKNCVISDIQNGHLDILFYIYCHAKQACSECPVYGKEDYPFKCSTFKNMIYENEMYFHEDTVRPHSTILLGFRYEIDEGDPISNIEQVRQQSKTLMYDLAILKQTIYSLNRLIDGIKKYVIENSEDWKTLDAIITELQSFSNAIKELYKKTNPYAKTEDDSHVSTAYDELLIMRNKYQNQLSAEYSYAVSNGLYTRSQASLIKNQKAQDYIEQKSAELLQSYPIILQRINGVQNRISEIRQTIRQIQQKYLAIL